MALFSVNNTKDRATDWKWKFEDYPKEKNGLKVFSCFSCGGGSTMGYKLAGCEVIGNCEIDPRVNETYKQNHNPRYNFCMDIREFNAIPNEDLPDELFHLDILDGSPPCTTFSIAGQREKTWGKKKKFKEGQVEQTLDDLLFIFIDTINKLRPKTAIMENVEGLTYGNAIEYLRKVYTKLNGIGYNVRAYLLKGEEMGIPQKRHRVFFIITQDSEFDFNTLDMTFNYEPVTFGEIKGDDVPPKCSDIVKQLLDEAIEGQDHCIGDIYKRKGEKVRRFNETILWDSEIPMTIHNHGHYRGKDKTSLSRLDFLHIATFPEDYIGNNVAYLVGMSVPPIMIKRIVTRMIEANMFSYKEESNED